MGDSGLKAEAGVSLLSGPLIVYLDFITGGVAAGGGGGGRNTLGYLRVNPDRPKEEYFHIMEQYRLDA